MTREKIKELENIEQELGVDLITILKGLLADKLYFKSNKTGKIEFKRPTASSIKYKSIIFAFDNTVVEFKDYGKTWALTKDELCII